VKEQRRTSAARHRVACRDGSMAAAAVGCLLHEIRSRKGMSGTVATDLYIGGPTGGPWGPVCAGQWMRVGPRL
jgi:hypothetical protein